MCNKYSNRKRSLTSNTVFIAAERERGSTLILTFQFRMKSVSFAPVFSPELYIVEISICVCGDVRFSGEQDFSFSTNTGELDITNFEWSSAHVFRFPCARVATFRKQNWDLGE